MSRYNTDKIRRALETATEVIGIIMMILPLFEGRKSK